MLENNNLFFSHTVSPQDIVYVKQAVAYRGMCGCVGLDIINWLILAIEKLPIPHFLLHFAAI